MLTEGKIKELRKFSIQIQMEVVKSICKLGVGHVGGSLSIADVLAVLYGEHMKHDPKNPRWEGRDWLVCSKGHAGPAVYAALALKGFMPMSELDTLNQPGTHLPSHCDRNLTPGVDMTTGSLGQGASTAAGVAKAHKLNGMDNIIYLILGDGEINEGQIWEMALFAPQHQLDNMIAFVDCNKLQIDGFTKDILDLGDIERKFADFGWFAQSVDGHDVVLISEAIDRAKLEKGRPSLIVLHTQKGHGWGRITNQVGSHSMNISCELRDEALLEMQEAMKKLQGGNA